MTIDPFYTTISGIVIALLLGATGLVWPKRDSVRELRRYALSKCYDRLVIIELDFHQRLNTTFVSPVPEYKPKLQYDIHDGIKNLTGYYVEEHYRLSSLRNKIESKELSLRRLVTIQMVSFCIFFILIVTVLFLDYNDLLPAHWVYLIVWLSPIMLFTVLILLIQKCEGQIEKARDGMELE